MKRFTALATSLVAAGSILLPTAASASPWVTATSNGNPVDGTTGQPGTPILIEGTGCDNTGGTAVMGLFVSPNGDPWNAPVEEELIQIEKPVDETGAFTWEVTIAPENDNGVFTNRWYCATEPVAALRDAAVTWVSPPASITIEGAGSSLDPGAEAPKRVVAKRMAVAKAAAPAPAPSVRIVMDPDALPAVDKIDILGPQAADLKAKVDKRAKIDNGIDRLFAWLLGRDAPQVTSADYVDAAFGVVGGRKPSAQVVKTYADRLDAGELKVQVVEDIALTQKPASFWNKH
ncbi:MAG: hypothetical protein R2746_10905 [Acidimicrobiales bacterium]